MINKSLGGRYQKIFRKNLEYLNPVYKQQYDVDLKEILDNISGATDFDEKLNWKLMSEKSYEDYH